MFLPLHPFQDKKFKSFPLKSPQYCNVRAKELKNCSIKKANMFFFYQSLLNGNLKKALEQFHLTFFQQEGKKASNMTLQKIYWHQRQKKRHKKRHKKKKKSQLYFNALPLQSIILVKMKNIFGNFLSRQKQKVSSDHQFKTIR